MTGSGPLDVAQRVAIWDAALAAARMALRMLGLAEVSTPIRLPAVAIEPSGNVWLANNWKEVPIQTNPGGNAIVVMVGAAGPLKAPLIGTPRSFERRFSGP